MSNVHRCMALTAPLAVLVALGCAESPLTPDPAFSAAAVSTAEVRARPDVRFFVPGTGEVVGNMRVVRNGQGVSARLQTSELEPGHAYTAWIILFEPPDLPIFDPPFLRLDGKVVGGSGRATFAGRLGNIPEEFDPRELGVHVIVRSHGPAAPGAIAEQLATAPGGCALPLGTGGANTDPAGSVPDEIGECANVQDGVDIP